MTAPFPPTPAGARRADGATPAPKSAPATADPQGQPPRAVRRPASSSLRRWRAAWDGFASAARRLEDSLLGDLIGGVCVVILTIAALYLPLFIDL